MISQDLQDLSSHARNLLRIETGSLQDLLTGTCTRDYARIPRFFQGPFKIFPQGLAQRSCTGLWQHCRRISTRSSHKDLYKIIQGPLRGTKIFMPGLWSECQVVIKGPAAGGDPAQNFLQKCRAPAWSDPGLLTPSTRSPQCRGKMLKMDGSMARKCRKYPQW